MATFILVLFKIGPLISLVSAFTVMIIVVLESKTLGDNLLFTFYFLLLLAVGQKVYCVQYFSRQCYYSFKAEGY